MADSLTLENVVEAYLPTIAPFDPGIPMDWVDQAACRDRWTWFDRSSPTFVEKQRMLCLECPVIDECLIFAMESEQNEGDRYLIYGGLTPAERRDFKEAYLKRKEEARV